MPTPPAPSPVPTPAPRPHRRDHRWLVVLGGLVLVLAMVFARFALSVHALADRHATGAAWAFPARLWSAELAFVPGATLPADYLREELQARGYGESAAVRSPGQWARTPDGMEIWLRGFSGAPRHAIASERVRLRFSGSRLVEAVRTGAGRGHAKGLAARPPALEPVLIGSVMDSNAVNREWVPLARMPRVLQQAVIASEDRRFRSHMGIDLKGNARALAANLRAGGVRQGASTITQQLARGLFLDNRRTLSRKLAELPLALGLELVLSKDRILEMYLNSVYFGRDEYGGIAGVAEASRRFFGKPVDALTPGQAALLVGVIPAPNLYSPLRQPENARRRRRAVLHELFEVGALDSAAMMAGGAEPLILRPLPPPAEHFPSYVAYVRQYLKHALPAGALEGWGLSVFTALDPVWQHTAETKLAAGLDAQEGWRGRGQGPLQGAFVLMDAASGEVRALVGGRDPGRAEFNRATQALRQPGSAFKPIVYAAALDPQRGGERLTPGSTVPDLRRAFDTPQGPWTPKNDEGEYHDTVTLAKALAKSLNVATANLVARIGAPVVARYAERFGLGRPEAVASIGLGTHEVTPLSLVGAYTVFVNGGWRHEPTPVIAVIDGRGAELALPARPRIEVLAAPAASLARGMLEDVVTFGISYPLRAEYGFTRPCGGKTGTTNDYRDAWFVGFTPELAAGVWVGYDAPQSLARPAAKVALPVWAGIMTAVLGSFPATEFPHSATETLAWIDPWTGGLARADCPSPLRVSFTRGSEPRTYCTRDHAADWAALRARAFGDSLSRARADSAAHADSLARGASGHEP